MNKSTNEAEGTAVLHRMPTSQHEEEHGLHTAPQRPSEAVGALAAGAGEAHRAQGQQTGVSQATGYCRHLRAPRHKAESLAKAGEGTSWGGAADTARIRVITSAPGCGPWIHGARQSSGVTGRPCRGYRCLILVRRRRHRAPRSGSASRRCQGADDKARLGSRSK